MSWQRILMLVVAIVVTGLLGLSLLVGGLDSIVGLTTPPVVEVIRPWISMVGSIVGFVFVAYLIFVRPSQVAQQKIVTPAPALYRRYLSREQLFWSFMLKHGSVAVGFIAGMIAVVAIALFKPYENLGRTALVVLYGVAHIAAISAAYATNPLLGVGFIGLVAGAEISLFLLLLHDYYEEVKEVADRQTTIDDLKKFTMNLDSTIRQQAAKIVELESQVGIEKPESEKPVTLKTGNGSS